MRKVLTNRQGSAAPLAIGIVLCLILLFTVLSEYLRLQIIASGVRDALQASIIAVATEHYDNVYNGLREGYSGAYTLDDRDRWEAHLDSGDVLNKLSDNLGLVGSNKYAGGRLEYGLSDLVVHLNNASFASSDDSDQFKADAWVTLHVPLSFGWEHLPPMEIRMKVSGGYRPKF